MVCCQKSEECEINKLEAMTRSTSEACEGDCSDAEEMDWITWRLVFQVASGVWKGGR
jgi:ribulose kinase